MAVEVAIGFVIAWIVGKARRAGEHLNGVVDEVVDAGALRVRELVMSKLSGDSAVLRMEEEAAETGEVSARTRKRLELTLEDAAEDDPTFAAALSEALSQVSEQHPSISADVSGTATASGSGSTAIGAIGSITGGMSFGVKQPADPGRPGQV